MAEYWYLANSRLKFEGVEDLDPIRIELWREVVEQDEELFWFETTPHGKQFFQDPNTSQEELEKLKRVKAQMDMNKKYGHGNVQFNYNSKVGHIAITHTRKTLKRIEKYFEIAERLSANLYKNKIHISEKQLDKLKAKQRGNDHPS